jgi:hypothetical protein
MPQILRGRRSGGVREVFGRHRPYGQILQLSPGEPVPPQAQVVQPDALEQGEEARGPAVGVGNLGQGQGAAGPQHDRHLVAADLRRSQPHRLVMVAYRG